MDKIEKYLMEKTEWDTEKVGNYWTVVRIWKKVPGKKGTDAINGTKKTDHDEVQVFKHGVNIARNLSW